MHTHIKTRLALWAGPGALALLAAANACSAKLSDGTDGLGAAPGVAGMPAVGGSGSSSAELGGSSNAGVGGSTAAQGGGGPLIDPGMGTGADAGTDSGAGNEAGAAGHDTTGVCATVNATAELEPVYLAFAFDVSGSMGNLGYPWYDPTLKWDPAVEATRAFLEDQNSAGLYASLTAFPIDDADETKRCDSVNYTKPDVAMTELPSTTFGERLDTIRSTYWGDGTPTRALIDGVMAFVSDYRDDHPGRYAIVLVTDGYPQQCGDANTISAIEGVVTAAANDLPTYVIGVKNPPITDDMGNPAPDTVSDLNGIADAGGTDAAFIIDTGDPEQTKLDFRKAVDTIRGAAISCSLGIPTPPDDRTFQKDHVVVSTTDGDETTELEYDQECKADNAWHYDSTTKPTEVVLCPSACTSLQNTAKAKLQVGFTCEQVITVR